MNFAEWEAQRTGQSKNPSITGDGQAAVAGNANPTAEGYGNADVDALLSQAKSTLGRADTLSSTLGSDRSSTPAPSAPDRTLLSKERYAPTQFDTPASAAGMELSRTAANAVKGIVRSPIDAVKGILGIPSALADTVGTAVTNPKGFVSAYPDALKALLTSPRAIVDPNTDPEAAASLAGQLVLGENAPAIGRAAVRAVPDIAGSTMRGAANVAGTVGKGAEMLGNSKLAKAASKYGPLEAIFRADPYGMAAAAAPPILRGVGSVLQKGASALRNSSALSGLRNLIDQYVPAAKGAEAAAPSAADIMRENVAGAREDQAAGYSADVARKLNNLGPSAEIPYRNTKPTTSKPVYQSDIDAEIQDLQDQGFGPGAVNRLVGKKPQLAASDFQSRVALEGLRNAAPRAGYSLQDVATGPGMTSKQAVALKAKPFVARPSQVMQGLRAVLNSIDDAATFGRSTGGGQR